MNSHSCASHLDDVDDDVVAGLLAPHKTLPCRLLYDERGAALFERICTTHDYYPTRNEVALLARCLPELATSIGSDVRVVEPGSGAGIKTRMLLEALARPRQYVPIDVSAEQLSRTAASLREAFPGLAVLPVCADYTRPFSQPVTPRSVRRTLVFFPGSTIGNFEPAHATRFLDHFASLAGPDGMLLLGADASCDVPSLLRAYDDCEGITAAFNRNILAHVNQSHDATFDLESFEHRAIWSAEHMRIEMHLVSRRVQTVAVRGTPIHFRAGEPIVTEHCYKYSPMRMAELLSAARWTVTRVDADPERRMHLWLASRA